jgi:hypothetical protein
MRQCNSTHQIIQHRLLDIHMKRFRDHLTKSELDQQFLTENWKQYDREIAYLYQQDMPLSSIKSEIDSSYGPISLAEIYRALRRTSVEPNRRTKPFRDDVIYFGRNGMELEEISKLTGYSTRQVRNILNTDSQRLEG